MSSSFQTLCFGDLVVFQNPDDPQAFIFGDGFLKSSVKMKSFSGDSNNTDFKSCIFQIYPNFVNTTKKQAVNFGEELRKFHQAGQKKKEMVEEMQQKLTDEYSFNLETFEKHKNVSINYSKIVQFLHVASNKFLSVDFVEAPIEKENYKVELVEFSSDSTFFKILPSFKYQKESEGKIFVEEIITIAHATPYMNKTPFLHCSQMKQIAQPQNLSPSAFNPNTNDITLISEIGNKEDEHHTTLHNRKAELSDKHSDRKLTELGAPAPRIATRGEINISLEISTRWKVHLFSKFKDEEMNEFLGYGDVIWLNNFERKISLIGEKGEKDENVNIVFAETMISLESLDYFGNTNGMWIIEHEDFNKGGMIEFTHTFRLKHLPTGKYLSVKFISADSLKKKASNFEMILIKERTENTLFSFYIVQAPKIKSHLKNSKFISKDSFIFIKHKKTGFWLKISEKRGKNDNIIYQPALSEIQKEEDVLKIARANSFEILETSFLLECKKTLMRYIKFLVKMQEKTITDYEISLADNKTKIIRKCLMYLELFVTNQLFNTNPYVKYGSINSRRQKILKEQYYIELLIQLLLVSIKKPDLEKHFNFEENIKKEDKKGNQGGPLKRIKMKAVLASLPRQRESKITEITVKKDDKIIYRMNKLKLKIVQYIFKLFIDICKSSEENEYYVYNFIQDFNYYFEFVPISIDFLISLVRNNENLIKKLSDKVSVLTAEDIEKLNNVNEIDCMSNLIKKNDLLNVATELKNQKKKLEIIESLKHTLLKNDDILFTDQDNIKNYKDIEFKNLKNNLILLFADIAKKKLKKDKVLKILKFFRTISSYDKRGITPNQEILFKIMKNEAYGKNLIMKMIIDNQVMRIELTEGKTVFLEDLFDSKFKEDFESFMKQLNDLVDNDDENSIDSGKFKKNLESQATMTMIFNEKNSHLNTIKDDDEDAEAKKERNLLLAYLNEQIYFFADVSLGRNYIWKQQLESVFSIQFVFAQIFNKKLFKETRSAFSKLALNLYIDQEPLKIVKLPNLCRIYKQSTALEKEMSIESNFIEKKIFKGLLDEVLEYIQRKALKINQFITNLNSKIDKEAAIKDEEVSQNKPGKEDEINTKNFLNNILLFDIVGIVQKLMEFNVFSLVKEQSKFLSLFPHLISFLEFDFNNPLVSYCIMKSRESLFHKMKEQEKKQNLFISGISSFKTIFSGVMENVTSLTKEVAGTILLGSSSREKSKFKIKSESMEKYNEAFLYSHPIMRGCISQRNQLILLTTDEDAKLVRVERELKILICDIIKTFLEMRRDFLLSNFLSWYQHLSTTKDFSDLSSIKTEIDNDLTSILPEILLTKIELIDEKYQVSENHDMLDKVGNNFMNIVGGMKGLMGGKQERKYQLKKFKVYTADKESEIKDLDRLLTGVHDEHISSRKSLFPSLIMMFFLTHDSKLECKLLEVMTRCFNQRKQFAASLANLEILFDKTDVDNYLLLSTYSTKLRDICQKSEAWFSDWLNKGEFPFELVELAKILNFLIKAFYTKTVEENEKIEEKEIDLDTITEKLIKINKVRQKICYFLDFHHILIDFLRDSSEIFEKIIGEPKINQNDRVLFIKIYKKIFKWLKYFVRDNNHNQEKLNENINQFLFHIDLDLGQIDLICEIYKNNQNLCENVKGDLLFEFIGFIEKIGRREIFLRFFEILQFCNGNCIFDNQTRVVNILLSLIKDSSQLGKAAHILYSKVQNEIFTFDFKEKPLETYLTSPKAINFQKLDESLYGDQPYIYHSKLLQIFILARKEVQGFNLNNARIRKVYNLSYIFLLLNEPDSLTNYSHIKKKSMFSIIKFSKKEEIISNFQNMTVLKPVLLEYLYEVYVSTMKREREDFQANKSSIMIFIETELFRLEKTEKADFANEIFVSYFFENFLNFAYSYLSNLIVPSLNDENADPKDEEKFRNIAECLLSKLPLMEECLNGAQFDQLARYIHAYFENSSEISGLMARTLIIDEKQRERNYSASSINSEIFEDGLDNITSWKSFLKMVQNSEALEKEIEKEKDAFCEAIIKIQYMFDADEKRKYNVNVEMKFILFKLIRFVEYAITTKEDKRTIIFTLEILINIIKIYPKKEEIQNIMDQNNALTMVLNVISESKNLSLSDDILDYLLSFMISLLEGGNLSCQKTIYKYFITIPSSEFFFEKIHKTIYEQIEYIKAKQQDNLERKIEVKLQYSENLKKMILEKILRIMQLFTEGHNLELQTYLKEQTHSRNSYDMVSLVIELLYAYHTDMSRSNYENILRCLETLTEFVQGPCPENQNALIDGKFLDVAYAILTAHTKKAKAMLKLRDEKLRKKTKKATTKKTIKKDKSDSQTIQAEMKSLPQTREKEALSKKESETKIKRWMLERLKYKCMILINSLLEMKSGYSIVTRIIRSLPLEVLKRNLSDTYRRYIKLYPKNIIFLSNEALKHFEGDPEERNNQNQESYYEFIIETGFLTFFLIKEYLNLIDDSEISFHDEVNQDSDEKNMLKGSFLGQLGSLGLTLFQSGLDVVSMMKNAVNENIIQKLLNSDETTGYEKEKMKKELRAFKLKQLIADAMKFFERNSGNIEVLRGPIIEKVYFTLPTYCQFLPEEAKTEFDENVDRTSLENKLSELTLKSKDLIETAKHEETLLNFFNRNKILAIFASYVGLWKELAFLMNIVLNIFIIFSFSDYEYNELIYGYYNVTEYNNVTGKNETNQVNITDGMRWEKRMYRPTLFKRSEYTVDQTKIIMRNCGITMIVCAVFVVLFFLFKKAPIYIKKTWSQYSEESEGEEDDVPKPKKPFSIKAYLLIKRIAMSAFYFFQNIDVIYYIGYAALAILGVTYHEFFFCFHLTELFMRVPTLKNVIKAVYEPRKALILTFILLVIFEYTFSLFAFRFFRDSYVPDSKSGGPKSLDQGFCNTLMLCFLYTFDYTFKSNGGIGSQLDSLNERTLSNSGTEKYKFSRFIFDNLFTIIIFMIMVTIVAGIIIDTFGLLRDQENFKNKDKEKICFICGLNKEIFDRIVDHKGGFAFHTKKDHYQWNYIYFIAYLLDKDQNEYTGIESYIYEKYKTQDLGWYPSFRALALKNLEDNNDEKHIDFIKKFESEISEIKLGAEAIRDTFQKITLD